MISSRQRIVALCVVLGVVALGVGVPQPARACGGLFCSAANPVNQAAERIIFSFDRTATKVTAVVEILYEGPAEKFAWVLPVPGIPEIGVSTSALLDRLQLMTNPTYSVQRDWGDSCSGGLNSAGGAARGSSPSPTAPGSAESPVSVLASGTVGPYDYEVIKLRPELSDPAMAAIEWLKTNGYEVGALGPDVLRPYLQEGLNLLAFRLSKNKSAGSIRPVVLTYETDRPMIPIRPTAVAANDDMGILVFVLGASRAVPINYRALELNETLIDWFNPNDTYNDVVSAAADEAGGQGFVTELAAPTATSRIADNIFQERQAIEHFRRVADGVGSAQLIVELIQSFSTFSGGQLGGPFAARQMQGRAVLDGVSDVLSEHLVLPDGVTIADVIEAPSCYLEELRKPGTFYCEGRRAPAQGVSTTALDRVAFLLDVEELVIGPIEKTVQLFRDQPYLTRLYTTMSAREMTVDPEFDLNRDLADVSNARSVTLQYLEGCPGDVSGQWKATIQGQTVHGEGTTWPLSIKAQEVPANMRILALTTVGEGSVVRDNSSTIREKLGTKFGGGSSGGCSVGGPAGGFGALGTLSLLLVAGLLARGGRRRAP